MSTARAKERRPVARLIASTVLLGLISVAPLARSAQASFGPLPASPEGFPVFFQGEDQIGIKYGLGQVAPGSDGSVWFIEDSALGPGVEGIGQMAADGEMLLEIAIPTGHAPNLPEASIPSRLALGPDGAMWFTDDGTNVDGENLIGRVSPTGRVSEYPIPNGPAAEASEPYDIAQGPDGDMWFTESGAAAIGRMSTAGVLQGTIPIPPGVEPREIYEFEETFPIELGPSLSAPRELAEGADGSMWFTNPGRGRVVPTFIGRVTPGGTVEQFPIAPYVGTFSAPWPSRPRGIVKGADGEMWFTSDTPPESESFVGRIDTTGKMSLFRLPEAPGFAIFAAEGIAAGPDGSIWFPAGAPGLLGRITSDGNMTLFSLPASEGGGYTTDIASSDRDLWLSDGSVEASGTGSLGRLWRIPYPATPTALTPPTLSGDAAVGGRVVVSNGEWLPDTSHLSYQWQLCASSGGNCANIDGETGNSHTVLSSDAGQTLRALVTADNGWGRSSIPSAVSVVIPEPPAPAVPQTPTKQAAIPLLSATLTWRFHDFSRYSTVQSLVIHGIASQISVDLSCHGGGCAFTHRHVVGLPSSSRKCTAQSCHRTAPSPVGELELAHWFRRLRLAAGTRISVAITQPGKIGKVFTFVIRRGRLPRLQISCLLGSKTIPGSC